MLGTTEVCLCFSQLMWFRWPHQSKVMLLSQKTVNSSLRVGNELLSQANELEYLGVWFMSDEKVELDRLFGAVSQMGLGLTEDEKIS